MLKGFCWSTGWKNGFLKIKTEYLRVQSHQEITYGLSSDQNEPSSEINSANGNAN